MQQIYETTGHVTINERMPTQRFNRFVDERIRDWVREHNLDGRPVDYEVAFFDEDPLGEVSCLIVLNAGGRLWRSWETADNPRLALMRSIENLRPETGEMTARPQYETQSVYPN